MKIEKEQLIKVIDFWQKSVDQDKLFSREILNQIDLKNREIVDLTGPRRSGKSSVLKLGTGRRLGWNFRVIISDKIHPIMNFR